MCNYLMPVPVTSPCGLQICATTSCLFQ
jgi:hypothetical protein